MRDQRLTIIVLNWNGWTDTAACLRRIRSAAPAGSFVLVVDNGSTDGSVGRLRELVSGEWSAGPSFSEEWLSRAGEAGVSHLFGAGVPAAILALPRNLGGAGGRNAGTAWALGRRGDPYVFFLDNDALIDEGTIPGSVTASAASGASIVGSVLVNADGSLQFRGLSFRRNIFYLDQIGRRLSPGPAPAGWWDTDLVGGAGMLMTRRLLEDLDARTGCFFQPDYFLYAEDQEICLRAKKLGHRVVMAGASRIVHKVSGGGAGLPVATYYSSRNRIFMARAHLSFPERLAFNAMYPGLRLVRAAWAFLRGRASLGRAHLAGVRDGYLKRGGVWRLQPAGRVEDACR